MKEGKRIEEVLQETGFVIVPIHGTSMRPLLKEGKCLVQIERKDERYERGDVVLFRKEDGTLVLHRIIEVRGNEYVVLGDHQYREKETIQSSQIIGSVTTYWINGKLWIPHVPCDMERKPVDQKNCIGTVKTQW